MTNLLRTFVQSPYVNLVVALILFSSGLVEGWDSLKEDIVALNLRVHHGVVLYGLFNTLKSLPDIVEGLAKMSTRTAA
jgi:hypothetical protein